jgi:hypothetical protein
MAPGADSDGIAAIQATTVEVLSKTGVVYEEEEALELLRSAGAVAHDEGLVKVPEALVEQAVDSAPSAILIYSREGEEAIRLEWGYAYCARAQIARMSSTRPPASAGELPRRTLRSSPASATPCLISTFLCPWVWPSMYLLRPQQILPVG